MIDLDIVVVNWNTGPQLLGCMQSISSVCLERFQLHQCIVVDNASADGSADIPENSLLPLTMIRNRENKGFAYACNQGAKKGTSEYILFLNPDCRCYAPGNDPDQGGRKKEGHPHQLHYATRFSLRRHNHAESQ